MVCPLALFLFSNIQNDFFYQKKKKIQYIKNTHVWHNSIFFFGYLKNYNKVKS